MSPRDPFVSATDRADLVDFMFQVERAVCGDAALYAALYAAQPATTDNVRGVVARKHGAIEVTLRFDFATWEAARKREDVTPASETGS